MTMPWSRTEEAEEDALALTDASLHRLLQSLYAQESSFFVHLVIEAALLSARVSCYGILVQPQSGIDGQESNDFVLHRDELDVDAVARLVALVGFQHVLLFSRHPDNRDALHALMDWPVDDGRLEQRLTAVYGRAISGGLDDSFDWTALDDIAESWQRDQAREEGPIHAVLLNGHLVHSTLHVAPVANTAIFTSLSNFETITAAQQNVFRDEVVRLWEEWAE